MNRAAGLARRITAGGCMEEITRLNEAIQDKQEGDEMGCLDPECCSGKSAG